VAYLAYGGIHFRNNLIIHTRDAYQGPGASGVVTENNWYLNINNWSEIHWDGNQAGSGDPHLVDLSHGDYHPESDSPLIGKGTNLSAWYSVDFEGKELPASGGWVVGALQAEEYVRITSPEPGDVFYIPSGVTINAEASDLQNSINKVEFYSGSFKLGEDYSSPYSFSCDLDSVGTYLFTAKAFRDAGDTMTSSPVWILVTDSSGDAECIWHSYDVITDTGFQPAVVMDQEKGIATIVELYLSSVAYGVDKINLFTEFNSGPHAEDFNHVEAFWANISGSDVYPYAGKSTVDRGSDSGETNTPEPAGVRDLQLHPPDNDLLTVASFMVPLDGHYTVSDLAVRRVHNEGNIVRYSVFSPDKKVLLYLEASNDRAWVHEDSTYELGHLYTGDRIYFGVGKGRRDNYYWDATEISWTVTKEAGSGTHVNNDTHPREYSLRQNYPNPFNSSTIIQFCLENAGLIFLYIYDIQGRMIRTLVSSSMPAGNHQIQWNGKDDTGANIASGIYFYRLEADSFSKTIKMIVLH
jgi:hypothetical protein